MSKYSSSTDYYINALISDIRKLAESAFNEGYIQGHRDGVNQACETSNETIIDLQESVLKLQTSYEALRNQQKCDSHNAQRWLRAYNETKGKLTKAEHELEYWKKEKEYMHNSALHWKKKFEQLCSSKVTVASVEKQQIDRDSLIRIINEVFGVNKDGGDKQ